jgi:DNA repair exonuclease SbcCD nuclease subunit
MERSLWEISDLAESHKADVLYAGDIFDKWNPPVELVNWALKNLPPGYAIPGNHDLPLHQVDLVHRSAYWTLVEAGKLTHLLPGQTYERGHRKGGKTVFLYAFPFGEGETPKPCKVREPAIHIALTHEYLWVPGAGFHGAPEESRLGRRARAFAPFDVVVVGDNHIGFSRKLKSGTTVFNCGTVFRRKSNEARYRPQVGLVRASGEVEPHYLDVSQDKITELVPDEEQGAEGDMEDFVTELLKTGDDSLDFEDAVKQALDRVKAGPLVREIVVTALGGKK